MATLPEGFEYEQEAQAIKQPTVLPEGFEYSEDTSPKVDEEEKSMIPDFLLELGKNWEERTRLVEESKQDYEAGKINFLEYTTQTAGKGAAGRVLDLGGAAISGALDGVSFLIPDSIEKPMLNTIKEGWDAVINTEWGQEATNKAKEGVEAYGKWKEANPQNAKTFESVVNVGLLFAPIKTRKQASPVPSFERTGQQVIRKGITQEKATSMNQVQNMLFPNITEEMAKKGRVKESGIFRIAKYTPASKEFGLINEVRKVPKIKPSRSAFYNLEKIRDEAIRESKTLEKSLEKSKVFFPKSATKARLEQEVQKLLKENTFIAGDAQIMNTIKLNLAKAKEIIDANPSTPSGLLNARREFDAALLNKMPTVFDAQKQTIFSESSKLVRNTLNSMINEKVPSAYVKQSLAKQSNLYSARDMLAPIATKQNRTGLGRLYQNLSRVIGFKMDLNRIMAVLGATSAFAVSSYLLGGFTGGLAIGGLAYGTSRLLTSPKTKKAVGQLIKYTNEAIQTSTNPQMIKQLRADRAFLQDLLELSSEKVTEQPVTEEQGD